MAPELDREGIVIAVLLDGDGGATEVGWSEVQTWKPQDGPLWLQLDITSPRTIAWLASQGEATATLRIVHRRPRLEVIDDQTVQIALRAWLPGLHRGAGGSHVTNLLLQPSRAVVLSRGMLAELTGIAARLSNGTGPRTISELTIEQLTAVTRRITDAVADLEAPMADLEFAAASRPVDPRELHSLRVHIADLRRHLTPARVVVDRLLVARPIWLVGGFEPRLTAVAEDLRNDEADLQNLLQRTGAVTDFMSARRATRMSEILYVLTIISAIMLPLTFITGLFGINVGIPNASYPGMSSTLAFLAFCAVLAILVVIEYWFLRRHRLLTSVASLKQDDGSVDRGVRP